MSNYIQYIYIYILTITTSLHYQMDMFYTYLYVMLEQLMNNYETVELSHHCMKRANFIHFMNINVLTEIAHPRICLYRYSCG